MTTIIMLLFDNTNNWYWISIILLWYQLTHYKILVIYWNKAILIISSMEENKWSNNLIEINIKSKRNNINNIELQWNWCNNNREFTNNSKLTKNKRILIVDRGLDKLL